MAGKWNYKNHNYDDYELPGNCKLYSNDMEEVVNCAQCGKEITFGESYTSFEIHNHIGFGYAVCEKCYQQEWKRKIEAENRECEGWD